VQSIRAIAFDFNGTLSADEHVLCEIFRELFAERGRPLSVQEYFDELAGISDPEIVRRWLGNDHPDVEVVIEERIARYRAAVADGSTIGEPVRAAVRYAAERVPLAVVSGASRAEIEPVLEAAGLGPLLQTIVSAEDVERSKPHPECYLRALELLGEDLRPEEVVVLEDTEAGVAAAKAAGMRCLAVAGTIAPERLREADEIVPALDVALMRRLLG
jgi:beta-phosphoglucomutase